MALHTNIVSFEDANGAPTTVTLYQIGNDDYGDFYHLKMEDVTGRPRISREDRKRLADALYRTLDLEPLDEDKGLKFNEVFQQEDEPEAKRVSGKDVHTLPVGTILRGTALSKGDRGYEFEVVANGRVRTVRDGVAGSFTYPLCYDNYEIVSTPEKPAETAAEAVEEPARPLSYGEVIDAALTRFRGAADIVADGMFVSETDRELATALRVLVAGLVISPRGERALRKLVGE